MKKSEQSKKNEATFVSNNHNTGNFPKEFGEALVIAHAKLKKSLEPIVKPMQEMQTVLENIADSLRPKIAPLIDSLQKWAEENKNIFINFSKFWTEFEQRYNITEQEAVKVLRKYKWFVTPSIEMSFLLQVLELNKKRGRQDRAVNELFIKYFESENWHNLKAMVNGWKNKPLLTKRYKILADCVEVVQCASKKKINEANVVLPTLITQIDGVWTDYLISNNKQWDYERERKTKFKETKPNVLTAELDNLANFTFLDILFQKSQRGKALETPFNFNRHKIIHGENVKYGRKVYLIRAFMILDFLAHLN